MSKPALKISPPDWMRDPDVMTLFNALNPTPHQTRFVGGCIRNYFFKKHIYDIDFASKLTPNETKEILQKNHIRVIETGLDHGTLTAHINGKNFEITTLRSDIETDGRHAKIAFSTSWEEDASRRDFTMNALYADIDGNIYDPLGTGIDDIQNHIVRFIGDPHKRITEDALRILRFFRFHADYHDGQPHEASFSACIDLKETINQLSSERIYDELFKTLKSDHAHRAIALMSIADFFDIPNDTDQHLKTLISLQNNLEKPCLITRYFLSIKTKKYIKNKKQNKFVNFLISFLNRWSGDLKHALYAYDRDVVIQGLLILKSTELHDIHDNILSDAINHPIPILPITATDIMNHFQIPQGVSVGEKIKQAEDLWIKSDFKMSRIDLLNAL